MTLELPLWMQNNAYAARVDRSLVDRFASEGVLTQGALAVTQRGAGANLSVDVAAGACVIDGDDQSNQGSYLCVSTAVENVVVPAAPGSLKRRDLIIARINDPQAGGAAGNNWTLTYVQGSDLHASDPASPAVPNSAILLATLLRSVGDTTVTTAMITDGRTQSLPYAGELRIPHTFTVPGEVKVPSGDTDYLVPMFVPVPAGFTATLVRCRHRINSGTSATVKLQRAGVDLSGLTGISVTTTSTTTTPATAPTFSDLDLLALVVTAVSGTPRNMSFTVDVRYRRVAA